MTQRLGWEGLQYSYLARRVLLEVQTAGKKG